MQANTNNVNKTCVLLQTPGGKDEPRRFYAKIVTDITTRNSERKIMSNTDLHLVEYEKQIVCFKWLTFENPTFTFDYPMKSFFFYLCPQGHQIWA